MIEVVFTLDYEIYGNGKGSLGELVYEPTRKLKDIFDQTGAKMVVFVEAAEMEKIEESGTDPAIHEVRNQIRSLQRDGYEIALHIHPQWYNARREDGQWVLDYGEYNMCVLPRERIIQIVDRAIKYLGDVQDAPGFVPLSFRAGNWLFQPALPAAGVLVQRGVKVDSSVFKGGFQRRQGLDYRRALRNGYCWRFGNDVNVEHSDGTLLELPIYTQMVPFWKMATGKRIGLQQKGGGGAKPGNERLSRLSDFLRFKYPLKFDFCRMTLEELIRMLNTVIEKDRDDPSSFKPLVAIGHTKDLVDTGTVESFLSYLREKKMPVSTFREVYEKCVNRLGS